MVGPTTREVSSYGTIRVANPGTDRYWQEMRGAYAGLRLWDPDFAISRDPWIHEKMLRDPLIRQCLAERIRAIAGGPWKIEPARNPTDDDEEAARVIDQCVAEIAGFHSARANLARFVWEGTRHSAIYGVRAPKCYGDGAAREWWYPTAMRDIHKRRVTVWREDGKIKVKLRRILDNGEVSYEEDPFPSDRIVTAVYDDEEQRLGFGRGLAESCYWFFFLRWKLMEEGLDAARTWAQGIMVAKTDAGAIGNTDQTSLDSRDALLSSLQNMKAKGVVVMGTTDTVENYDGTGQGAENVFRWFEALGGDIRKLLGGAELPSGGNSSGTGSLARAEVEQDTSEGVYQMDAALLDDAITDGLIRAVWDRNRENLVDLGLGDARMPSFRSEREKHEDPSANATVITALLGAGLSLKKDEAYRKAGFTVPTDEDIEAGNVIDGTDPVLAAGPWSAQGEGRAKEKPAVSTNGDDASDVYVPDAAAYARIGAAAMFAVDPDLPDWLADLVASAAHDIRAMMRAAAMAGAGSPGAEEAGAKARASLEATLADAMAASDLDARAEVLARARAIAGEGAADSAAMPIVDHAAEGTVPQVPFSEAVEDILAREPMLRRTAEAVAGAYQEGPAFALAKSADLAVTREVQRIVAGYIEGGDDRPGVAEIMRQGEGFAQSYAETVLRTNSATAATEGRFAQVRHPDVRAVIPAFRFSATRDSDVRRGRREDHGENHLAADGLVAAVDDPIWVQAAPPAGYNCRCSLVMVTVMQLRREGLLNEDGTVKRHVPEGFGAFRRHPNFARGRMPGSVL